MDIAGLPSTASPDLALAKTTTHTPMIADFPISIPPIMVAPAPTKKRL